ncbi:GrpB family protein [Rossellomorea aquimaris]|uniref:GrpB family protein n=1 Tax=Rossellomorea aquimaris TaxID=189382 RepID=UPI0007D05C51|nr:GrpB family protein [Rossellomorea aquimaris]
MKKEELGRLYPITIYPYNEKWPFLFENEKQEILSILGSDIALRIEHIGSTAVPGLSAKPTVDLLVEIPEGEEVDNFILKEMTKHNYIHMKEQKKHSMFVKGYTPTGLEEESFHIHMAPSNQDFLWDRLYFRDYLREHVSIAKKYEHLKVHLSKMYKNNREEYTEKKTDFVLKITQIAKNGVKD